MSPRPTSLLVAAVAAIAAVVAPALPATTAERSPGVIHLPDGFRPEGITTQGTTFYVGSIPTGAVYRGSLRTGDGGVLVPPRSGRAAIGMKTDRGLLFVAGGPTGRAFVYDARTGADVAQYALTTATTFVNDVTLTRDAAYFTDSLNAVLYRVARNRDGAPGALSVLPLTGEIVYGPGNNANGIAASRDGRTLLVAQSNAGSVFAVDAATGATRLVALTTPAGTPATVPNADGILLDGRRLYVVQNRLNVIARIDLAPDLRRGVVVSRTAHPDFDVPTTIAAHDGSLYAVNARFGNPAPDTAPYAVLRLPMP
ncbi:MAG: hypothetical protein QOE45_172 [Frankiaceae bacterium]|jgi:sugar lactone lactonase YvrE|nr:hypothetical protein [Frankiaceae bacterium]